MSEAMNWLSLIHLWVIQKSCPENKCKEDNIRLCWEHSEALKYVAYDALEYMEKYLKGKDTEEFSSFTVKNQELHDRIDEYDAQLYKDFLVIYDSWNQVLPEEHRRQYLISCEIVDSCNPNKK